ncbi:DNA repair protein XRCC1 [Nymphon striatum]|nr:DNA repair protein XRCC1 [Nymphon striatum]
MPVIPLKHVVSVSSEDRKFPADNLLKAETYRKWKCKENGENKVSVILQFDKSYKIHSVDIGNESSAFIEILVGSSSDTNQDFKVLLPASSFMSPSESKSGKNLNRVRMFDSDKLSKAVISSKWDLIKIVCTQPFNKHTQYGISFITFHSHPENDDKNIKKSPTTMQSSLKLGSFTLKPDDNQIPTTSPGSLFLKRKLDSSHTPTGAAAIRRASNEMKCKDPSPLINAPASSSKILNAMNNSQSAEKQKEKNKISVEATSKKDESSTSSNNSRAKKMKIDSSSKKEMEKKKSKPFKKIMKKVVFVLSGFQNPQRGEIRDKALAMGASYNSDWNSSSTHLLCAFKNTPKYNSVKNKCGRIVKKEWIEDCYQKKELLPWRSYGLGSNNHVAESSESETSTDGEEYSQSQTRATSDTEDTDDEILRARQEIKEQSSRSDTTNIPLPELSDIFLDKCFLLFGEFSKSTKKNLYRIITAFGGEIEAYMNENVNFVITESEWDSNFDDALTCNSKVNFLKPAWVDKCLQENKLVLLENFVITSS